MAYRVIVVGWPVEASETSLLVVGCGWRGGLGGETCQMSVVEEPQWLIILVRPGFVGTVNDKITDTQGGRFEISCKIEAVVFPGIGLCDDSGLGIFSDAEPYVVEGSSSVPTVGLWNAGVGYDSADS